MALKWEKGHVRSKLSSKAFEGGRDTDGSVMFVGRAFYSGVFLPAKIIPSKSACYVSYGGAEVFVENFEVLVRASNENFVWEPACDGRINEGAISTGREGNDELYIGRAPFKGSMTVGKIHPSHRCMYMPYNGKEERLTNYEVLVHKKPKLQWMPTTSRGPLPRDATLGGRDSDGAQIFVGRASHEGDMIPCKVIPTKQVAYVSHNGSEISKHNFDILIGNGKWQKEKNGRVPAGAFPGGVTRSGETLYIGRAEHQRSITVGKIHPSHGCLYIPYGGKEVSLKDYEVLISP